jgi:hypothetical protein
VSDTAQYNGGLKLTHSGNNLCRRKTRGILPLEKEWRFTFNIRLSFWNSLDAAESGERVFVGGL